MATTTQALKSWEDKNNCKAEEFTEISLCAQIPPVSKLDNALNNLHACKRLSLSTNMIDRMIGLGGMTNLRILSLGRNNIKKIEKLDEVSATLEQLWISYNAIATLDGLSNMAKLTTLYCSNNKLRTFAELDKVANLQNLKDVLFIGNPMYDTVSSRKDARIEVLRHLPQLSKIDGEMVKPSEREALEQKPTSEE